jgi:hypothetical protein
MHQSTPTILPRTHFYLSNYFSLIISLSKYLLYLPTLFTYLTTLLYLIYLIYLTTTLGSYLPYSIYHFFTYLILPTYSYLNNTHHLFT